MQPFYRLFFKVSGQQDGRVKSSDFRTPRSYRRIRRIRSVPTDVKSLREAFVTGFSANGQDRSSHRRQFWSVYEDPGLGVLKVQRLTFA